MSKSWLSSAEFCPFDLTLTKNTYFKNTVVQIKLSSIRADMWNICLVKNEQNLVM